VRRVRESCLQQHAHEGPWFQYWRVRLATSVGAVIPGKEPVRRGRFVPVMLDDDGYPT
jgi:hypothetical protein